MESIKILNLYAKGSITFARASLLKLVKEVDRPFAGKEFEQ